MSDRKPPGGLVCVRMMDTKVHHPQEDSTRSCRLCGKRVTIYPSGQLVLAEFPATPIMCDHCYRPQLGDVPMPAPGALEEAAERLRARRRWWRR